MRQTKKTVPPDWQNEFAVHCFDRCHKQIFTSEERDASKTRLYLVSIQRCSRLQPPRIGASSRWNLCSSDHGSGWTLLRIRSSLPGLIGIPPFCFTLHPMFRRNQHDAIACLSSGLRPAFGGTVKQFRPVPEKVTRQGYLQPRFCPRARTRTSRARQASGVYLRSVEPVAQRSCGVPLSASRKVGGICHCKTPHSGGILAWIWTGEKANS